MPETKRGIGMFIAAGAAVITAIALLARKSKAGEPGEPGEPGEQGAVTISNLRTRIRSSTTLDMEIDITNNTGDTIAAEPWPIGPNIRIQLGDLGFLPPGTDYDRDRLRAMYRPVDLPSLPPGRNTIRSSWTAGFRSGGNFFDFGEGDRGFFYFIFRRLRAMDPVTILYSTEAYFEGVFISQWHTWQPTSWRPPPEPPEEEDDNDE